ncbi:MULTISPECIES: heptaprenylglyceryl phosphate synthase [unclassified Paenibacillus]|uniref:heptaprenylglyceryl phosphate synthase n=1 Tax=unclassified Paenibacillus TaxID=185978 RepID=UPI001B721BC0|nr:MULTISPECIES: heptaprenylglyceryl phosphate synthase [unclassified Paenibacillus]MBP1157735.1 putative glycerol-1-phosphate prenyltransferase [Paenibacillus sp. PvP091]MBP1171529.1 putative glycerol-1-phosphate prenyltransferase [Paenibacillus sp. PvR098]MBP2442557.1 putative glycerol-1-phosphate prenyltransferase [Paenibacillus sp. PvP052]
MHLRMEQWKHVFKLDPDRELSDEALERVCLSGTDAVMVGGSTGITFDNTVDLLARIRRYEVPCVLEVSDQEAIVPGFDLFMIPIVLNAGDTQWIVGRHHQALKEYGAILDWQHIVTEGYIILNEHATAAKLTEANTQLSTKDVEAYARMGERLFRCPIVYLEYSGVFGDMALVSRVRNLLGEARLFYGGGIDGPEKARQAAEAAHTIVVGNAVYENLEHALATVEAVRN